MHAIKTAISLEPGLFTRADAAAQAMKVSRSKLITLALNDFLERQKSQELLAQLDAACAGEPDTIEQELLRQARRQQRRLVEGEW